MAKPSNSPSYLPHKPFIIFLSVLLLLLLISLVFYRPQNNYFIKSNTILQEYHTDNHQPYHDTLEVNLDFSSPNLNPKIAAAEKLWKDSSNSRKVQKLEEGDPVKLIKLLQYFPPSFSCPYAVEPIGNDPFGSWVCGLELFENKEECNFYSYGIATTNLDPKKSIFETGLLNKTQNCRLYIADLKQIQVGAFYRSRVEVGLISSANESLGIVPSDIPNLGKLLKENGHGWVDILRIDLGNFTQSILDQVIDEYQEVLPFGQVQIRLTLTASNHEALFWKIIQWFQKLEERGLRPFHAHVEKVNCGENKNSTSASAVQSLIFEYSFINLMGKHALLLKAT